MELGNSTHCYTNPVFGLFAVLPIQYCGLLHRGE